MDKRTISVLFIVRAFNVGTLTWPQHTRQDQFLQNAPKALTERLMINIIWVSPVQRKHHNNGRDRTHPQFYQKLTQLNPLRK